MGLGTAWPITVTSWALVRTGPPPPGPPSRWQSKHEFALNTGPSPSPPWHRGSSGTHRRSKSARPRSTCSASDTLSATSPGVVVSSGPGSGARASSGFGSRTWHRTGSSSGAAALGPGVLTPSAGDEPWVTRGASGFMGRTTRATRSGPVANSVLTKVAGCRPNTSNQTANEVGSRAISAQMTHRARQNPRGIRRPGLSCVSREEIVHSTVLCQLRRQRHDVASPSMVCGGELDNAPGPPMRTERQLDTPWVDQSVPRRDLEGRNAS